MNGLTEQAGFTVERAGKGRLKAAWVLVLLAPLCAEAAFTGISLPTIWLAFPLLIPLYGAGVLLARELVCRAGSGLLGLLVIGFGYELAEDGLGLQALTSPHMYFAANWGRVFGINITYWESQLAYHLVFSVLIPVVLTNLIFKRHARRPYLGTFGLIGTAVVFVIGIAIARLTIAGTQDPGYQVPLPALIALVVGIIVLGVLATLVVPRLKVRAPAPVTQLPSTTVMGVVAGITPIVFLGLIFPLRLGGGQAAIGHGALVAIPMVIALAIAIGVGWLVARWSATDMFTDRHRLWLIGGALVGHSVYALASGIASGRLASAVIIGVVVIGVTVLLLVRLGSKAPATEHVSR